MVNCYSYMKQEQQLHQHVTTEMQMFTTQMLGSSTLQDK